MRLVLCLRCYAEALVLRASHLNKALYFSVAYAIMVENIFKESAIYELPSQAVK